jgi:hypothetical protein
VLANLVFAVTGVSLRSTLQAARPAIAAMGDGDDTHRSHDFPHYLLAFPFRLSVPVV